MTVPYVATLKPANVTAVVIAHLLPLGTPCTIRRHEGDPLPFRVVNRIAGGDNLDGFYDRGIVSVHSFAAAPGDAIRLGDETDSRMRMLAYDHINIPMTDGTTVNVDYFDVQQGPVMDEYDANFVWRTKAVYELWLSFV